MKSRSGLLTLILVLTVSGILILLAHWVLYETVIFALPLDQFQVRAWFRGALLFLSLTFPVFQVLIARWRSAALNVCYTAAALWLGTLHILLLGCGIFWIIAAIAFRTGKMLPWGMLGITL